MAKNQNANKTPAQTQIAKAVKLDWTAEAARIEQAAKDKPGSRGDYLGRVAVVIAGDTDAARLLRERCGDAGAQAIIEQPRNVLAKLGKLAQCMVAGTPWCSAAGMAPEGRRKEDASIVVALHGLGAGNSRQKENVAQALGRYPGGANAQMPAALEALAFMGVVERKAGGKRNADYALANADAAAKLMPQ